MEAADKALLEDRQRITNALSEYAYWAAIEEKSASQIRHDLKAILGEPHVHQASADSDACALCGRDLRHWIHSRETR